VFPHSRALDEGGLEEERRLFYVGVTRAMRNLYLTSARRRAVFGAQTYGLRSRFLDEIPGDLLDEVQARVLRPGDGIPAGVGADRAGGAGGGIATSAGGRAAGGWAERSGNGRHAREAPLGGQPFRLGEDVVHAAFGDGVVTAVEPDGVIVVRFADDGSERKLMAEYAPVSRR